MLYFLENSSDLPDLVAAHEGGRSPHLPGIRSWRCRVHPRRNASADHVAVRLKKARSAAVSPFTRLGKSKTDRAARAQAFPWKKRRENGIAHINLARRLKRPRFAETEPSVTNKLMRGRFRRHLPSGPCRKWGWRVSSCKRSNWLRVP